MKRGWHGWCSVLYVHEPQNQMPTPKPCPAADLPCALGRWLTILRLSIQIGWMLELISKGLRLCKSKQSLSELEDRRIFFPLFPQWTTSTLLVPLHTPCLLRASLSCCDLLADLQHSISNTSWITLPPSKQGRISFITKSPGPSDDRCSASSYRIERTATQGLRWWILGVPSTGSRIT